MTKVLKSKYSLHKNFEEDISGRFLFKMKRREITRKLFSYAGILNKIKPLRLSDLLIRKKKQIRGIVSRDILRAKKIKHFYGFRFGKTKTFNKFSYRVLHRYRQNRLLNSISFLEARIDVMLVRLQLFLSITEAQNFITRRGLFVNSLYLTNFKYKLKTGDILTFCAEDSILLKRKLYLLAKSRPLKVDLILRKDPIMRELLTSLTIYTWIFRRYTKVSSFFTVGFPRYVEINLNSMEFYFYGKIKQFDVSYPFKSKITERTNFFSNYI